MKESPVHEVYGIIFDPGGAEVMVLIIDCNFIGEDKKKLKN